MTLPNPRELIDELDRLEALRDPSHASKSQRMFDRVNIRTQGKLEVVSRNKLGRASPEIQVRDCSLGGLGFVTPTAVDIGSVWNMLFYRDGFVIADEAIIVRHCGRVGPGLYLCGGQFCATPGLLAHIGCDSTFIRSQFSSDHGTELGAFLSPEDLGLLGPDAA